MGASSSNANRDDEVERRAMLICKPEQSGKTFVMLQQIIKDLDDQEKKVINIIFCDNSLLLVKQTSIRVHKDVEPFTINGESYIEFSSRDDGNAMNKTNDIFTAILTKDIRNVISCTNRKRVNDVSDLITKLNTNQYTQNLFEFKIWLDEADKYTKFIDNNFKGLLVANNNVHLTCLTATPDMLFKKYKNIHVFPIENTTSPDYHGWEDNNRVILENSTDTTIEFICDVLSNNDVKNKISKGSKWYIPGDTKKSSHYMISDYLVGKGFAVFVVNGDGILLTLPTEVRQQFSEDKTEELNKQITRMCNENKVDRFPVAITGHFCVGRAITIMSPGFIFDYAILSNCTKKAEVSQNAGRTKGNIKSWPNYKPPTVYTTAKFDAIAIEMEGKSRRLAEIAFGRDEVNPSILTKAEFNGIGNDNASDLNYKVFDKDEDSIDWFNKTFVDIKMQVARKQAPKELHQSDGSNPTLNNVLARQWGLSKTNKPEKTENTHDNDTVKNISKIRKVRLNDDRICVYWRPSLMKEHQAMSVNSDVNEEKKE